MSTVQSASSFTVIAAHLLFADDTIFVVDGNNETEIEYKVNRVLMEIGTWCEANKLSLSPDKTCYTVFWTFLLT